MRSAYNTSGGSRGVSKVSIETPFSLLTRLTVLTLQIVASCWSSGRKLAALGMLRNSADSALLEKKRAWLKWVWQSLKPPFLDPGSATEYYSNA